MPDYGHDLMFGAMLEPERAVDAVALAVLAEQAGLDAVSLADHPYWPERLDTFALLAFIAARTDRVRVFPNLANLPLRPPAMLARTAATLDVLSDGRFELGIGSGAQQMWEAIVAEGGPLRDAAESIDALDEAVQVIRALWVAGPEVSFTGRHYRIVGAKPGPAPAHDMNIWLGAYQPRMLGLVGRVADGWIPSSPLPAARTASCRQPDHRRGRGRRRPIPRRGASHLQHRRRVQPNRQGFPARAAGAVGRAAHRAHAGPWHQRVHPLPGRIRRRHKAIRRRGGPGGTQRGKHRARPARRNRTRRDPVSGPARC